MRRLFWLAMGVTIGVLAMRKVSQALDRLSPQGMASGIVAALRELADAIGDFGSDVRAAMTEREDELRRTTGLDGTTGPAPAGSSAPVERDVSDPR